ncbi:hypothetical protein A1D22_04105 [Pasteurellaceae bacterium LFhippo2]|nr:hypothetical protein [Pasteurellaceae bacterium LFhippo2]
MKRFIRLFSVILFSNTVLADPFYPKEESEAFPDSAQSSSNFVEKRPICAELTYSQAVTLPVDFAKIRLIGLVKIDDQFNALFVDEQKQLISLKENDFLPKSNVLITQINLKSVHYWQYPQGDINECETPQALSIKL